MFSARECTVANPLLPKNLSALSTYVHGTLFFFKIFVARLVQSPLIMIFRIFSIFLLLIIRFFPAFFQVIIVPQFFFFFLFKLVPPSPVLSGVSLMLMADARNSGSG